MDESLELETLTIKGQTATISSSSDSARVTLTSTRANSSDVVATGTVNQSGTVEFTLVSSTGSSISGSATDKISSGTYTLYATAGGETVTYTLTITVGDASSDATLSGVTVKGVDATRGSGSGESDSDPIIYSVELTYNQANGNAVQAVIETADANAAIGTITDNSTGIDTTDYETEEGALSAGNFTFDVTAEDGETKLYYQVDITLDDSTDGVTLAHGSHSNASVVGFTPDETVTDEPVTFNVEPAEGWTDVVVTYQIGSGEVVTLEPNADGSYTLTTDILTEAAGQTLTITAAAQTQMLKISAATGTGTIRVNNETVTDTEFFYVESGDSVTVTIKSGNVLTATGTYGSCTYDSTSGAWDTWEITNITSNLELTSTAST